MKTGVQTMVDKTNMREEKRRACTHGGCYIIHISLFCCMEVSGSGTFGVVSG